MDQTPIRQHHNSLTARLWLAVFLLGVVTIGVWLMVWRLAPQGSLTASFFDVGQGDAAFLITPGGARILIDAGADSSVLRKLGSQLPLFDRRIDLVILTHPHADHLGGLIDVLKRYRVRHVVKTDAAAGSAVFSEFLRMLAREGAEVHRARTGQTIKVDPWVRIVLLAPTAEEAIERDDLNAGSIVARLSFGDIDFMLMGDATKAVEQQILQAGISVGAEVLKVGHHGSRTSSSAMFLAAVNPDFAVISSGAGNSYGHPHRETLEAIERQGAKILRTDTEGDVYFSTDGRRLTRGRRLQ